jgi:pyridoxamine 5'-phosphate oxidase
MGRERSANMTQPYRPDPVFIDEPQAKAPPMATFERWYGTAKDLVGFPANAMSLATVSPDGAPDVRIVLLQAIVEQGLVFFTNLNSIKGKHLRHNTKAAACFHWPSLGRQVRLRGDVHAVDDDYADRYFEGRPRRAQVGAHVSAQSSIIESRAQLLESLRRADLQFAEHPVPRPPHWSGLRLVPTQIEFWQDGTDRLHDRLLYLRAGDDTGWSVDRLAP